MNAKRKTQPKRGTHEAGKTGARPINRQRAPEPSAHAEQPPTDEKLRESEERYRLISGVVSDYVFSTRVEADGALRLNWVAGAFEAITGYTFDEYRARGGWAAALHPDDVAQDARDLQLIHQNRDVISTVRTLKKDGSIVWAQVYAHPVWDDENQRLIGICGAVQDVSERKRAENDLRQKNRALRTYSACSQALAHLTDEALLLTEICKICVEIGGYRLTRIGYADPAPTGNVRPVASWGASPEYLNSSISLPLTSGGRVWGVLNIYSAEPEAFDEAEVALLADLAGDVAFGIEALRARAENRRTVELLQASEERYRLLVDQSPYAIAILQDGAIVFANSAAARLLGASAVEDLLGRAFESLVPPDYLAVARYRVERMLNGDSGQYPAESRLVRLDGQSVAVEVTATPFVYAGQPAVQMIALDISDRKEAAALVRRANEFSNALLDSLPGVFYFYDADFHFLRWNKNFETVTGYTAEEIARMSPLDFFGGADRALISERIQAVFTNGSSDAEAYFVAKDGTQNPYYFTGLKIEVDGQPALIGVGIDITKRKQAEQALRDSQKQLALIYETVRDVIFLLGVEPGEVYRFASVNPVFLAATGLTLDQVVGRRMEEVLPESAHEPVRAHYREAIRTNQSVSWEEVSVYPTGTLYGNVTVTPALDAQGICTHLIGTVHDITQIRRAEQEIRKLNQELEQRVVARTAQLETANKELESFSYSVSHDLRAPLRAISGFAEIIARRHRAALNAEGQHYFDNIVQASERMSHLIDDLLQYSRLGRQALRPQPVALGSVLAVLAKDLEPRLAEIGGTLEIAGDLPTLTADKTLLNQIFTNLLENAITYRRPDVPLRLAITWQAEDGAAVIGVRDNGIGIPAEHHQRIFNIFQRLHSDDLYPGTGIGLATVKKSAEMLGGSVWVESEVGSGSTFFVRLPKE